MRIWYILAGASGLLALGLIATAVDVHPITSGSAVAALPPASSPLISGDYLVAAPGRVEPASEEIRVAASTTGLLREVLVKAGDKVNHGDVLARIESDEYAAALAKAGADLELHEAELQRVVNGARTAERDAAYAAVGEAEAVEKTTHVELDRRRSLTTKGFATRQALEQAEQDYEVAQQHRKAAFAKYVLVNDPARAEDVVIAKARVTAAHAAVEQARAELDKTVVRCPIEGTVLRVHRRPGELVSTFFVDQPIVTVGDLSKLYVRAEVDETDIAKVARGQSAYVTAEAYGGMRFPGKVVNVGEMLGQKTVHTGEPTERADTRVLEVLIELDSPSTLRPGLRVNSFIQQPAVSARPQGAG